MLFNQDAVVENRLKVDKAFANLNAAAASFISEDHRFDTLMQKDSLASDRIRNVTAEIQEHQNIVEGSLQALGPEITNRLIVGLHNISATLTTAMEALDASQSAMMSFRASVSRYRDASETLHDAHKGLSEATNSAIRAAGSRSDAMESLVSWVQGYLKKIIAERVDWQQRHGINPLGLPEHPSLALQCLLAMETRSPNDCVVRSDDTPSAAIARFVCRLDRSNSSQYTTPREELALVKHIVSSSSSSNAENQKGSRTNGRILFEMRYKADHLTSQLRSLRDAFTEFKDELSRSRLSILQSLENYLRTSKKTDAHVSVASVQTDPPALLKIRCPTGRSTNRTQSAHNPRAFSSPRSILPNKSTTDSSHADRVQLCDDSKVHDLTLESVASLEHPIDSVNSPGGKRIDTQQIIRKHGASRNTQEQTSGVDSLPGKTADTAFSKFSSFDFQPPDFTKNAKPRYTLPRPPSGARAALQRLDEKVQRAIALTETLETRSNALSTSRIHDSDAINRMSSDLLKVEKCVTAVTAGVGSYETPQKWKRPKIERADFDNWIATRIRQ